VCWLSAGVSSLVAGYLTKDVDEYIYIHIKEQHEDSLRFIKDCERFLGKPVKVIESGSVHETIKKAKFINSPYGARCTLELKKKIRHKWEKEHADYDITYVWGFDLKEKHRADRILETYPEFNHEFPLIENCVQHRAPCLLRIAICTIRWAERLLCPWEYLSYCFPLIKRISSNFYRP
jgi:hypothetical protein